MKNVAFRKIVRKGEKLVTSISPLPTMFYTLLKTQVRHLIYIFSAKRIFSISNILVCRVKNQKEHANISMSGMKERFKRDYCMCSSRKVYSRFPPLLTHFLIHHIEDVPNSKKLQMTTEMWLLRILRYGLHRKHRGKR